MEFMKWFFDGLGTEIVSLIVGAIGGGLLGFRLGKKSRFSQSQKAGKSANQTQEGNVTLSSKNGKPSRSKTTFRQTQKAGDNSTQSQVGGTKDV